MKAEEFLKSKGIWGIDREYFKKWTDLMEDYAQHQTQSLQDRVEELESELKGKDVLIQVKENRIKQLEEALRDIKNPIGYLKKQLNEGDRLNGQTAITMCNDPQLYKNIAEKAKARHWYMKGFKDAETTESQPVSLEQTMKDAETQFELVWESKDEDFFQAC